MASNLAATTAHCSLLSERGDTDVTCEHFLPLITTRELALLYVYLIPLGLLVGLAVM